MGKIIYIVGIGGRTGAMFCRELQGAARIIGVGMDREIEAINNGKIKTRRGEGQPEILKTEIVRSGDFAAAAELNPPDFIWLAVRNPVAEAVKFYYSSFKGRERIPALILSQNGLSAIGDAQTVLREALGQDADRVEIVRVSLINGIDLRMEEAAFANGYGEPRAAFAPAGATASRGGIAIINYKLPVKLGFGILDGQNSDFKDILRAGHIRAQEFKGQDVFNMENSKLFTNLIGMVSAIRGVAADQGLRDKKIFKEEIAALGEYVRAVKKSGNGFVDDFCGYPIKFLAQMMLWPLWLLLPLRGLLANIVAKGRNRPKDLSEIDYYNGEVVKLGKQFNIPTSANEAIVAKAKEWHGVDK
ncbi:MAG: ketopantoate reductase C-terminal domain-containing protein [Minisyncoccales bacterium]